MLTQMVSPPAGGHSTQRSSDAIEGFARQETSLWKRFSVACWSRCRREHELRVVGVVREDRVHLELAEAAGHATWAAA